MRRKMMVIRDNSSHLVIEGKTFYDNRKNFIHHRLRGILH